MEEVKKPEDTNESAELLNNQTENLEQGEAQSNTLKVVIITLLVVAVIAAIGGGAFILGKKSNTPTTDEQTVIPTQAVQNAEPTTQASIDVSPTISGLKSISGGLPAGSTSFKPYTIQAIPGWTEKSDKTDITDKLTLTNGAYSLTIYQAPMGGGGCLYPGDTDSVMAQRFTDFVLVTGTTYRRSWNKTGNPAGTISYTVCQQGSDGSYGSPTSYGAISVKSPDPADAGVLFQIDNMISSLRTN